MKHDAIDVWIFQNTYEKVSYEIIGDGQAPGYFSIDAGTGKITLKSLLSGVATNVLYVSVFLKSYTRTYYVFTLITYINIHIVLCYYRYSVYSFTIFILLLYNKTGKCDN